MAFCRTDPKKFMRCVGDKKILYFEWSPPWHFKAFRALVRTLSYKSHCKTHSNKYLITFFLANVSGISSDILSGILSGIILGDSFWLRGTLYSALEPAVEVRRGTLWSGACGEGPAGNTLILSWRWRSGGGTLWSGACGGGPAGNALIQRLLLGSAI